jgi:hypothetical protein
MKCWEYDTCEGSTLVGSCLAQKYLTWVEVTVIDKRSSLLQYVINYARKISWYKHLWLIS